MEDPVERRSWQFICLHDDQASPSSSPKTGNISLNVDSSFRKEYLIVTRSPLSCHETRASLILIQVMIDENVYSLLGNVLVFCLQDQDNQQTSARVTLLSPRHERNNLKH